MDKGLNERQQKFIDEYMKTGNARKSALAAGYSENTADKATIDILRSEMIKKEMSHRQGIIRDKFIHTLYMAGQTALLVEIEIMSDGQATSRIRRKAARDILDRINAVRFSQYYVEASAPERKKIAQEQGIVHRSIDNDILNDLWERQKGRCAYCKQKMKLSGGGYDRRKVSIDHVTPKSKDGSDGISNIVLCCLSCNLEKSNLSLKEFASEKGLQFEIESLLL